MPRSSFSQHSMFVKCPRWWYYQYVKNIPTVQDTCYMDAGTTIHHVLEKYYNKEIVEIEPLKEFFNKEWKHHKLDDTKLAVKKYAYWNMVLNGINLKKSFTSTEMKIFYPDEIVAYLDVVDTNNDEIADWKSSTRSEENEREYRQQQLVYAWLYKRKFGRLPKKCTVYYLKYAGSKGEMSFTFNEDDIVAIEQWFRIVNRQMEEVIKNNRPPERCSKCHFFCPFKEVCFTKEEHMDFTLHFKGNYIYVAGPFTPLLHKGLDKKFSYELKNAHFIKKAKPMAKTTIQFWNPRYNQLPIGFKLGLVKTLEDYAKYNKKTLNLNIKDERQFDDTKVKMPEKFVNGRTLREYQEDAVATFLIQKICILEIGTGGGKTEIAIEAIRKLGTRTLFVVDKVELLKQTKKRIEDSLGIEVGQIGHGEENIKDVTVATVQTLSKHLHKYEEYLRSVRFVILDECHKVAARSYFTLGRYLKNTEYRLGLSGTAFRDDGNDMMINATVGDKVFDLSSKTLIEKGWLVKPNITFIRGYMTSVEIKELEETTYTGLINETPDYANFYDAFITKNRKRNELVKQIVDNNEGKKILILTKLIEHGQALQEEIEGSLHLYGDVSKKSRDEIYKKFVNNELRVLVGTLSIFSEGIDIPDLDIIINCGANRGQVKSIQMLGRVLRKIEGKSSGIYYDFFDESKFFRVASLARIKAFRDEGHDIKYLEAKDLYTN